MTHQKSIAPGEGMNEHTNSARKSVKEASQKLDSSFTAADFRVEDG
jgi:hypothetical protein